LHSKQPQESPQYFTAAITTSEVKGSIQESGAEHLTTTNTASGVEEIVVEFDREHCICFKFCHTNGPYTRDARDCLANSRG